MVMDSDGDICGEQVTKAHQVVNPLETLDASLKTITLKDGRQAQFEHFKVQQLPPPLWKWIMDLMIRNMKRMYKRSLTGWKSKKKHKEMTGENSRYIVGYIDSKPVAFSHFQFDMDYGRQVLYCYEIQVEQTARSLGVGKGIMEILAKISQQVELPLVVLTVFKFNLPTLEFFKRLGYVVDETSPDEDEYKDYLIMSKAVS